MKAIIYPLILASFLLNSPLFAQSMDHTVLVGVWNCSFEASSPSQTLVGTSVDTYFADGRSMSTSKLSVQHHILAFDIVYDLSIEGKWSVSPDHVLQETVVALPTFSSSNPALEQKIRLQQQLLNAKTESSKIIELSAHRAVFQAMDTTEAQHQIECNR